MANYTLNDDKMFADVTDGIAIVINSETGIYYGMNEFGTIVFENLMNGASTENVLAALKTLDGVPADIEEKFNEFVNALLGWEVLIEGGDGSATINIGTADDFVLDVREYTDAQELLLADPIHQVKEETGWAPDKSALNPDEKDIAKREAKME